MLRMKAIHVKALLLLVTGLLLLLNGLLIMPNGYFNNRSGQALQAPSSLSEHEQTKEITVGAVIVTDGNSEIGVEESSSAPTSKRFVAKFANLEFTYNLAIPVEDLCSNATVFVFVPSRATAFEVRAAIRSTWAADKPSDVVFKFILGNTDDPNIYDLLAGEHKEFNDLIIYNIEDTYENLYLKVHAAFNWHQAFCNSKYVLKADDDTIIHLDRLLYWIRNELDAQQAQHPSIIFGGVWKLGRPIRAKTHKWHVPREIYPLRIFPNYCNGPSYMLSSQAVADILKACPYVKAFPIEDILFTGVASAKAGVKRQDIWHHFRWSTRINRREKCSKDRTPLLTGLYSFKASEMERAYTKLKNIRCW